MGEGIRKLAAERGLAALGHVALALLVTAPMVLTLDVRLIGHPDVDVWNHAWGLWWFWSCLKDGVLPLSTTLLNAPAGGRLWFIDPIGGLVGMGLVPLVGLTAAWNLTILFLVTAASVAGRTLARALGAADRASWIGAIGVAASPHLISELHNGISEASGVAWPVFALAALVRAIDEPARSRQWVITGLLGGLTALGTYYYAISLFLVAAPLLLGALWRGPRLLLLRGMLAGALPAMVIAVPVAMVVHSTVADSAQAIIPRQDGAWQDRFWALQHNAVDPLSFLLPGDFQSVDLASLGENFRHTSYLGWLVLVPAFFSSRRRWLWAAAVPLVFSLGPFLWVWGDWVRVGGHLVALPYRLLLDILPPGSIAHPQRLGFLGMALVAGLGASRVRERDVPWLAAGLLVELLLLSPAPWPVARVPAVDVRYAEAIGGTADARRFEGQTPVVLDLPVEVPGHGMASSRALFFQTLHGQPIPFGPNVRADAFTMYRNQFASALVYQRPGQLDAVPKSAYKKGDLGWIALHTDLGGTADLETWLRAHLGDPHEYGPVLVWDLRPPPGTPGTPGGPALPPGVGVERRPGAATDSGTTSGAAAPGGASEAASAAATSADATVLAPAAASDGTLPAGTAPADGSAAPPPPSGPAHAPQGPPLPVGASAPTPRNP